MKEQKALNSIVKAICKSTMEEEEKKELLKMAVILQQLIDKSNQIKDYSTKLEQIQQRLGDKNEQLEMALEEACDNLEVLSTCEVFPNIKTKQQWKEWCLKKATE